MPVRVTSRARRIRTNRIRGGTLTPETPPPMDINPDPNAYLPLIVGTVLGFALLAALLLVPVSRFISRERAKGERWNQELRDQGMLVPRERLEDQI